MPLFIVNVLGHLRFRISHQANAIGDAGCAALARALEANTSLRHLDLHACNLHDDAASALAAGLRANSSLAVLNLKANYLSDRGATALAQVWVCARVCYAYALVREPNTRVNERWSIAVGV